MSLTFEKFIIGKTNRVYLNTTVTLTENHSVTLTVVDDTGTAAKDESEQNLIDKTCTWDDQENKFYFDLTFLQTTVPGFFRLYWVALDANSKPVTLEAYFYPQDVQIIKTGVYERELISVTWFVKTFLENISLGDYTTDRIREVIQGVIGDMETEVQTSFTLRTIQDECYDYYAENFRQNFWLQKFFHTPVHSIQKLHVKYSDALVADVNTDWLKIQPIMGTVEMVPEAGGESGYFYTMLLAGLGGLGHNIFGGFDRIPFFFHFDYTHGLDWDNLDSKIKASIQNAIGRRAAIKILPKLDSRMGVSSESRSIDGVSESTSYTSSAMYGQYSAQIEQYKKEHDDWVKWFRRQYCKDIAIVIA